MEEKNFEDLTYLISYPQGFHEDKKYPLVILLHGAGSREETTKSLRNHGCLKKMLIQQDERGYILLAPLCKRGTWNEWMTLLIHLNLDACDIVSELVCLGNADLRWRYCRIRNESCKSSHPHLSRTL